MNNEYTIYNLRYVTGPLLPLRDLVPTPSGFKTTAIMDRPLLPLRDLVATSSGFKTTAIMDRSLLPLRDLAATSSGFKTTAIMLLVLSRIDRLQRGRGHARGH